MSDGSGASASTGRFLLGGDRVVNAGAGTGKTHALLTQYLHLCAGLSQHERPLEPRALCALTFTDKAAGELRGRLQQRTGRIVRALAALPAEAGAEAARGALREAEPELVASAEALGRPLLGLGAWARVREQLGGASIGTFHSFAATLLRRYAAAAGLDPDFGLLDEDRSRELALLAAEQVVLQGLEGQLAEVSAEEVARLVSEYGFSLGSSPGGGLVEALCRLYAQRAEEGRGAAGIADAYRPAALTSERARLLAAFAAAVRGLSGLEEQLGKKSAETLAELGGLCAEALEALARAPGRGARDGLDALPGYAEAIRERLRRLRAPSGKQADKAIGERLQEHKDALREVLVELAGLRLSAQAAPLAFALERLLEPVEAEYAQRKRQDGALDFTDLLRKARDLLRDRPVVRAEVRARITVLLVDELQDTSPLQAELVELIAGPPEPPGDEGGAQGPRANRPGRLYLVGDRKQSIYGFRGADVAAYTALCDRMQQAGAEEETLDRSRRSRPPLLRFVNALFARVMQPPRELAQAAEQGAPGWYVCWDPARDPLHPVRPEEATQPAVELVRGAAPAGDELAGRPQSGAVSGPASGAVSGPASGAVSGPVSGAVSDPASGAVSGPASGAVSGPASGPAGGPEDDPFSSAETDEDAGAGADDPLGREADLLTRRILALHEEGARFGEIAVLLRRYTHLARYTTALKRAGVPHYVVRGRGFYQAPEVLDVAALFTLLDDPEDRLALLAVLRSPLCGLSDEALVRLHLQLGGRLSLLLLLAHLAPPGAGTAATDPQLGLSPDEAARLLRLLHLLRELLQAGERIGPAACLRAALDHTDYLAVLAADPDGEQRIANVERLLGRARSYEPDGATARRGGLRGFVRALRLMTDPQLQAALGERPDEPAAQVLGEADDVVRILTVHQAKGLEFPIVLVAGCAGTERTDQPLLAYDRAVGLGLSVSEEGERAPTLAWIQTQRLGRLRAEAESARLFYVAATRARDRLIFLGESRRRAPKGSWREQLDRLLAEPPLGPAAPAEPPLLTLWQPGPPPPPPAAPEPAQDAAALVPAAREVVARVYDLPPRTEAASGLGLLSAQWAELLVCPRRLHLGRLGALGLRGLEGGPARPRLTEEVLGLPPHALCEGGLLNRLLFHCDPRRGGEDLPELALGLGLDAEQAGAAVLFLRRFLRGPAVHRLLEGEPARTAVRWGVRYTAPAAGLQVSGVLDALFLGEREGVVTALALDVWDTTAPPAEGALHKVRRHLLALAARSLCPQAQRLEVGLCFVREPDPAPQVTAVSEEPLAALLLAMQGAAPAALQTLATVLEQPPLPQPFCRGLGCEYLRLCHPEPG